MGGCRKMKEKILGSLYGELSPAEERELSRHLETCPDCRAEHEAMARTLLTMGAKTPADPGTGYWDTYFDKLEKRMVEDGVYAPAKNPASAPARPPFRRALLPRRAFAAAGAIGLLAAGILIGRLTLRRGEVMAKVPSASGQTAALQAAAGDLSGRASRYVGRSKVILLAIANFDPGTKDIAGLNLPVQKAMSRDLVREAAGLKDDLRAAGDRRLERLVGELETILIQIANLKSETDLPGVEIVKAGVGLKDILFKINLSEARKDGPGVTPPVKSAART
jgi:hypothetical protein